LEPNAPDPAKCDLFGPSSTCDTTDPRSYGGTFQNIKPDGSPVPVQCVPNVLDSRYSTNAYPYCLQLRFVFSEGLNGDLIETQDNVLQTATPKPGVVTAMSSGIPQAMPVSVTYYYDPTGADFLQGQYGTAPPGPAIIVIPGSPMMKLAGLPSGSMTDICLNPADVTDLKGNHLDPSKLCGHIVTRPFSVKSPLEASTITADSVTAGLPIVFTAPLNPTSVDVNSINLDIGGSALPTSCYTVTADTTVTKDMNGTTALLTPTLKPPCPITSIPTGSATLTIAATVTEQYGIQLGEHTIHFTIAAPSMH
jgi:hypothetical protein